MISQWQWKEKGQVAHSFEMCTFSGCAPFIAFFAMSGRGEG